MSSALTDWPDAGGKDYGNTEQAGAMIKLNHQVTLYFQLYFLLVCSSVHNIDHKN